MYHFGPVSSAAPRRRRFAGRKFSLGCDLTACAKEDRGAKTIKKPYARSTETLNGDLFKKYCAVCHGHALRGSTGDGSSQEDRLISHGWPKKGGAFPSCRSWINQRQNVVAAFGSQDMPICGTSFPNEFKPGFGQRSDLWPIRVGGVTLAPSESHILNATRPRRTLNVKEWGRLGL